MQELNFDPFPILHTERLLLRPLVPEDETAIFALRTNEAVNRYLDRPPITKVEEAGAFIQMINNLVKNNESVMWAISFANNPGFLGSVCLWNLSKERSSAEIGYELHPDNQGKGIMQEALPQVIAYGFDVMKLKTIEAYTHKENQRSSSLLEKNGFKRDTVEEKANEDNPELNMLAVYKLANGS